MNIFDFEYGRVYFYGKSSEDRSAKVSVPVIYLQKMKIDEEDRLVKITYNDKTNQLIIEKAKKEW